MDEKERRRKLIFQMAYASTLGIGLVVTIFGCLYIGILIDRKFGTGNIFTSIFLVLGVLAGFRNFWVFIKKYLMNDPGVKDREQQNGADNKNRTSEED